MRSTLIATALCLAASAAMAQQSPTPQAATRPAWMGPGLVHYLASAPADLNLTRDQQSRIRQAGEALERTVTPLHQRLATLRATMVWGNLTVDQRLALADTTRQLAEQARTAQLGALDAVNATLTAEQRNTLEARWQAGRRGRMGRGMMGPGMMGRGMMGRGMRGGMMMGPGMAPGAMPGAPMQAPRRGWRWEE